MHGRKKKEGFFCFDEASIGERCRIRKTKIDVTARAV